MIKFLYCFMWRYTMVAEQRPKLEDIKLEKLELWYDANVRKSEELTNIENLAGNIRKNGLRVPLLVKKKNNKYMVFSGQRRLLACQIAQIHTVPCFVFNDIDLTDARILSLSENLYREAMTMEDKSNAARALFEKFGDMDEVAAALGVKVQTVKGYFTYDAIPDELKQFARKGGNLTTKQVGDIYTKFADITTAKAVAKKLAGITNREKQLKMHAAIRTSAPSDDIPTIERRTEKLLHMKEYKIILPDIDYKLVEKVAYSRRIKGEDLLIEIVEDWVQKYNERGYA